MEIVVEKPRKSSRHQVYEPTTQLTDLQRRHNEYWSNNNKMYNRMRSSKSLENFYQTNNLTSDYYQKNSSQPMNQAKYSNSNSYEQSQPGHFIDSMQQHLTKYQKATKSRKSSSSHTAMEKKIQQSSDTKSFDSHSANYYDSSPTEYYYSPHGRMTHPNASTHAKYINASSSSTSSTRVTPAKLHPYPLNEIDPNIIQKRMHSKNSHFKLGIYEDVKQSVNGHPDSGYMSYVPPPPLTKLKPNHFVGMSESNLSSNHLYKNKILIPEPQVHSNHSVTSTV